MFETGEFTGHAKNVLFSVTIQRCTCWFFGSLLCCITRCAWVSGHRLMTGLLLQNFFDRNTTTTLPPPCLTVCLMFFLFVLFFMSYTGSNGNQPFKIKINLCLGKCETTFVCFLVTSGYLGSFQEWKLSPFYGCLCVCFTLNWSSLEARSLFWWFALVKCG